MISAILKEILFLLLFLTSLLLFLLLFLLFVPLHYQGSGAREEKQLSDCLSVSWLSPLPRFDLSYAVEKKTELSVLDFRVYHNDGTEDTADVVEENDFDYPEFMALEDFEPDTAETVVVEQQKAVTEQAEIPLEYFGVTKLVPNRKGTPPQREGKRRRNVPEEEQRAMRCHDRSRHCFRKQRDQISADTRELQDSTRSAEIQFDFFRDERAQRFLRFLKRKVFRFSREFLSRRMSDALRFGFADPILTGQGAVLTAILLSLYRDNLEIEPLLDRKRLSRNLAFRGRMQLLVSLFGTAQPWFHPDLRFVYRHLHGKDKRKNREDTRG